MLIVLLQLPSYYLLQGNQEELMLYIFLIFLIVLTLFAGAITGLLVSLVFIFFIGSVLLYFNFANTAHMIYPFTFSMKLFFFYGLSSIVLVLIAGKLHESIVGQRKRNEQLQMEVQKYVAVDVETGFDNRFRMEMALLEEMKRSDRTKKPFIFVLLKLDYLENFRNLYGNKETKRLILNISKCMDEVMRFTDKKFRYDMDQFALILPETQGKYIDLILDKLRDKLSEHTLSNNNLVTLTYHAGYFIYEPETEIIVAKLIEQVESEMISHEL
ncbi:diguanylate cyclase domain-containing protein [Rummeliibacillus suwonensis]|uniref:diguanylate cyclase domain-containing protein n=1 Tax=Rummeliibacillus suwonensis TaxID=1306154 RepID=UPI0011B6FFA6|nr:diguanylate cyclase [Rummeliibacillus suwonensis]MBO2537709.1 diguanylate cyclase [Rummeliibacillus suwonensis]